MISEEEKHLKTSDAFLQKVLVKTLLKIATKYRTFYLATIFTDSFLKPLLLLMLAPNAEVRLISQKIFHTLLDRHDNLHKLEHLPYVPDVIDDLRLTVEKCSRQDQLFMRRHINNITSVLYRNVCIANESESLVEHLDATLCSMSLLCVEVGHDETLIELFRLVFALQTLALNEDYDLSYKKRLDIHNLVAKYLNLSCQLLAIPALVRHVEEVIINRSQSNFTRLWIAKSDPLLNPKRDEGKAPIAYMESEDDFTPRVPELGDNLYFNREIFEKGLDNSKKDVEILKKEFVAVFPMSASDNVLSKVDRSKKMLDQKSQVVFTADGNDDADDSIFGNPPDACGLEENTLSIDTSSIDWSPPESRFLSRRETIFSAKHNELHLPMTIETLRAIVHTNIDQAEEERKDREISLELVTKFRDRPLDEITTELAKEFEEHDLSKTIQRLTKKNKEWNKLQEFGRTGSIKNIFELKIPSTFVSL